MKIAIHGLGRMGMQIAHKLTDNNIEVIAHNRSVSKIDEAVGFGAIKAETKQQVIDAFQKKQIIIWLMLPADIVDDEVDEWLKLLPTKSIIIDGGNSDFRKTKKLSNKVEGQGHFLIDIGVSGGIWGYDNGFSLMAGGNNKTAFDTITPALSALSLPEGGYAYFGPSGSGHFVKMVHNAIEYGIMESLAEGYHILKDGPYDSINLADAGEVWQHHSVITSWLNELCRNALKENPKLNGISGYVAENGEARWTLEVAKELGINMPSIESALQVRIASQQGATSFATKLLSAMRNKFGGHAYNKDD